VTPRRRVILTGGGTGGHVYPALAVAAAAAEDTLIGPADFLFVGGRQGLEAEIVMKAGLPFEAVAAAAVRGRSPLVALGSLLRMLAGVGQAQAIFRRFRPDAVLATGGFVCVPVVLAARLSGVPSVVYLPDLRPGWAVRFLARFATVVAVTFDDVTPHIPSQRVRVTGYPVRPDLARWSQSDARRALGLPEDQPVVLVLGGSRGARGINEAIASGLDRLSEVAYVVHVTGSQNFASVESWRAGLPAEQRERYRIYSYLDAELASAMAAASLVVTRSGASVLGELPAIGAPAVLVPYPFAGAHQRMNAKFLSDRGAAVVVADAAVQEGALVTQVLELLGDPFRLAAMADASRRWAQPDGASRLYRLLGELAAGSTKPRQGRRSV